jgi:hypothetical protein
MKKLHSAEATDEITLAAVVAVLYFCAILLFSYIFNLT